MTPAATEQEQKLELECLALGEELSHLEAENRTLKAQLLAHKTFNTTTTTPLESIGKKEEGEDVRQKEAEIATSRVLLQRLASLIASFDPHAGVEEAETAAAASADSSRFFNLDQSFSADTSSVINPKSTFLTTPNGKNHYPRSFASDLVDEIETLRSTYEESCRRTLFLNAEQRIERSIAQTRIAQLTADAEEAKQQLSTIEEQSAEKITQLETHLVESQAEAQTRIHTLELQLHASEQRREDVQTLLVELDAKRTRLHNLQRTQAEVTALERQVQLQTQVVDILDERAVLYTAPPSSEDANSNVVELTQQITQLEERVVRRTEQIGSQQRRISELENDLSRTRTNQVLAEETVEELDAEVIRLRALVTQLESTPASREAGVDTQMQLESSQTRLREQAERLDDLTAQLETVERAHHDLLSTKITLDAANAMLKQQLETRRSASTDSLLLEQHELELKETRSSLRKAEERSAALALEVDALQLAISQHRETASEDADHLADAQAELDALRVETDRIGAERDQLQEELKANTQALEISTATYNTQLATATETQEALQSSVQELNAQIQHLETLLLERDAALQTRNAEFWTLKEEVAELQEAAEMSRDSSVAPETLVALQTELGTLQMENSELQTSLEAQESNVKQLRSELESSRATEEMLNQQYSSAQARMRDLESTVRDLETDRVPESAKDSEVEEELRERIQQLEAELGAKADEIEEADSKILDALKESKKYATRYMKLTAKFEALQTQMEAAAKASEQVGDEGRSAVDASSMVVAGRKRSSPDEDGEASGSKTPIATTRVAKGVYAPSPHQPASLGNGFTPVRRTGTTSTTTDPETAGLTRSTSNPSELIAARLSPTKPTSTTTATPGRTKLGERTNLPATSTTTVGGVSRLSSKAIVNKTDLLPTESRPMVHRDVDKNVRKQASTPLANAAPSQANAAGFLARMKAAQLRSTTA